MNETVRRFGNRLELNGAKPVFKWAGGKSQLWPILENKFPASFDAYIDPFLGGASIPMRLKPKRAYLSDLNQELIDSYIAIRDNVEEVIKILQTHVDNRDYFNELRSLDWRLMEPSEIAARMIYINKVCFNGLYRVNKQGMFNVSYANPTKYGRKICDADRLRAVSNTIRNYDLRCCDFRTTLQKAKSGDLIFLDPPYDGTFSAYTAIKFTKNDQQFLAKEFTRLVDMGCHVIACNSSNSFIYSLYSGHKIETIGVRRSINCKKDGRTGKDALIFSNNAIPANDDAKY